MYISKLGGLIAASKKGIDPLQQLGNISIIERIVLTMQQVGIFPIVVVTGEEAAEVRYCLANYGVIFLHNEHYASSTKIDSIKIGINFLKDKCERLAFTSVNIPMFSPQTIRKLVINQAEIVTPSYLYSGGHPVLLSKSVYEDILNYTGENGLQGAIQNMEHRRCWVNVEDVGIRQSVFEQERLEERLSQHNQELMQPVIKIMLEKEKLILDSRGKLLLFLIASLHSVRQAAIHMALSYSKAWEIIHTIETELSFQVVNRRHGGAYGGRSDLTDRGYELLEAFLTLEEEVLEFAQERFKNLFVEKKIFEKFY